MALLIRFFLISLIIFLLIRSFARLFGGAGEERHQPATEDKKKRAKGVPKEVGEYVDYEEVE